MTLQIYPKVEHFGVKIVAEISLILTIYNNKAMATHCCSRINNKKTDRRFVIKDTVWRKLKWVTFIKVCNDAEKAPTWIIGFICPHTDGFPYMWSEAFTSRDSKILPAFAHQSWCCGWDDSPARVQQDDTNTHSETASVVDPGEAEAVWWRIEACSVRPS